jgi:proteasome lid subunit RPN8/RPN11
MSSTPFRLLLPLHLHNALLEHARTENPYECCGLLAGSIDQVSGLRTAAKHYPLVNDLASPTAYLSEPRSILAAFKDIDRQGLEHVAIYHSHPTSPAVPSPTDLAQNYYGDEMIHIIVTLQTDPPTLRAWRLFETRYEAVEICT